MDRTVLVTGANGYTGHYFSRYLAERGVATRAMYYPPDGKPDLKHELLELVPGDIRNRNEVERSLEGIKTVYHIAALYRPTNVPQRAFWDVNVDGTRNMVELAVQAGVERFVHCSTIGVHGTTGKTPVTEDAPIQPDDYYQETKWEGEKLALELSRELGLALSVIRPAGIYGPGERRFLKITQLVNRRRFVMFGSGETCYHFIHVKDLSDAFVLAAQGERSTGRSYIIADDGAITLNSMVAMLADSLGVRRPGIRLPYALLKSAAIVCEGLCKPFGISPPMHRRRAAWFVSSRAFDTSRARDELGYSPTVKIEDGMKEMVGSFSEAGWLC